MLEIFHDISEIPYATDGAHVASELREFGRGDCHAKARVLADRLSAAGVGARVVRWEYRLPAVPEEVLRLPSRRDLHTTVEVLSGGVWVLADPTIDSALAGYLETADWDGVNDSTTGFPPTGPIWRDDEEEAIEAIERCLASIASEWDRMPMAEQTAVASTYRQAFRAHLAAVRSRNGRPTREPGNA